MQRAAEAKELLGIAMSQGCASLCLAAGETQERW